MKLAAALMIYDTHELETETNELRGIKSLAKIVEFIFINTVDHVFVVSENIADWYKQKCKFEGLLWF